jgi:complex III assembly factor LYRM7
MSTAASARSAYRTALRATKLAFQGDEPILNAARLQIKQGFHKNQDNSNIEQVTEEIGKLNEVSKFLTQNIVQGEKQGTDGKYLLKFHDKTELGDNDTIKQKKSDLGSLAGAKAKKCTD